MNFHILTLFPDMVMQGLSTSIIGRAKDRGLLSIEAVNIRDISVPMQRIPHRSIRYSTVLFH